MRACSDDALAHGDLAKLVANDAALSAEILRMVNSSYYGLSREVGSLARAIGVIGQRALRNLVLCFSVRELVKNRPLAGFDIGAYWEDTLRRAAGARLLGHAVDLDPEESFTVGLLQDIGLLTLFFIQPQRVVAWEELRRLDPDSRLERERQLFGNTHDAVGRMIAQTWQLPDAYAEAFGNHHHLMQSQPITALSELLYCADWIAAVFSAEEKGRVIDRCRGLLEERLQVPPTQADELLAQLPGQTEEAAAMLGLSIREQIDFENVLREANVRLAEANLSYQELTWELENAIRERDRLAAELNRELALAREIQQSLLPSASQNNSHVVGINVSAKHLSGDFFDYFTLEDGRIWFTLGDVSGKGVNAAILMAKTCSLFRCLGKRIKNPSELMALINEEICETSVRGMFVTMIGGVYHPDNDVIIMVNAGNPPALYFDTRGKARRIDAQFPPLGVLPGIQYTEFTMKLNGGSLYLYSDGVTEGEIGAGKELGMKGFAQLVSKHRSQPRLRRLQIIVEHLSEQSRTLRDDVTLMLIESCRV
jgi:serine phosphatase RsbU (regulator of sigma subunit)/HD-like signal output (HDOD) protein